MIAHIKCETKKEMSQNEFISAGMHFCGITYGEDVYGKKILRADFIAPGQGERPLPRGRGIPLSILLDLQRAGDPHPDLARAISEIRSAHQLIERDPSAATRFPDSGEAMSDVLFKRKSVTQACPAYRPRPSQ